MHTINVARDFTRFPSGRFKKNGTTSGEAFREKFLDPYLKNRTPVAVELDGTIGYGSSFLEEAFGGAVRTHKLTKAEALSLMNLISSNQALLEEIRTYIEDAANT